VHPRATAARDRSGGSRSAVLGLAAVPASLPVGRLLDLRVKEDAHATTFQS
jgi:hypothetical protein